MEIVNLQRGMWCLIYKLVRHQRSSPPPDWWVGGCQSITRLLLITAVSRRQKVRDGSTTLYSLSVGCEHEPIACTGHAEPCEGSIRRCRIAESSERRLPRTVAQLWLKSYRAWSDALSASGSQSALFSTVMYFQNVYERRSSTMAHPGPPAERGGEVALKKPSRRALAHVWLATVLSRICPPLFLVRSRLIASRRPGDATLPSENNRGR